MFYVRVLLCGNILGENTGGVVLYDSAMTSCFCRCLSSLQNVIEDTLDALKCQITLDHL